ncbi:MAG: CPBP family intramembrane glutamic endopeptidase [Chitinophagales bacterium]
MKYFRTYPWGLQLLLFLLMAFTFLSSAGVIIASLLPKLAGIMPSQLGKIGPNSPAAIVSTTLIVEGVSNLCIFLLPAFLFAYLTHPQSGEYLGLRKPGKWIQPVLAILVMLGAMPVLEMIGGLISHINFGPSVKASQQANEEMMAAFLNIPSFAGFIKVFVILAIIPALGEEMFFRGVLMRFAKKKSVNMVFPVLFTAVVFAFVHSSVYGFISIFLAGILLAVIYNLTGSLWCSILAHLFFNGSQIILSYTGNNNAAIKKYLDNTDIPYYLVAAGVIVFGISFYLLLKNKTPLPKDWAEDFKDLSPSLSEGEGEGE